MWKQEYENLSTLRDIRSFDDQVAHIIDWLNEQEITLNNLTSDDCLVDTSIDSIDKLIKKHENHQLLLQSQSQRFDELRQAANELIELHNEQKEHVSR